MSLADTPHIIILAKLRNSSPRAWFLERLSDGETFWVPKSVAEWQSADTWMIAQWWAKKEGLDD